MDGFLSKPFRKEEMVRLIQELAPARANAHPVLPDSGSPVDRSSLLDLLGGDSDALPGFIELFQSEFARLRGELERAVDHGSEELLRQTAHELKGIVLSFGAESLAEPARRLEVMGANRDLNGAQQQLEALDREMERVRSALMGMAPGPHEA